MIRREQRGGWLRPDLISKRPYLGMRYCNAMRCCSAVYASLLVPALLCSESECPTRTQLNWLTRSLKSLLTQESYGLLSEERYNRMCVPYGRRGRHGVIIVIYGYSHRYRISFDQWLNTKVNSPNIRTSKKQEPTAFVCWCLVLMFWSFDDEIPEDFWPGATQNDWYIGIRRSAVLSRCDSGADVLKIH